MTTRRTFRAWGQCSDCNYEGMLEYSEISGEDYADFEALGVMLLLRCPACDTHDNTLVAMEYYHELVRSEDQE